MSTKEIRSIPMSAIFESPDNPRKTYDQAKLEELADTIRAHGVQQPIKVRVLPMLDGAAHFTYEIIFGHRRFRAAKLAGLDDIPCMVEVDMSDETAQQLRLIENLQREDVSPVEEAEALVQLISEHRLDKDALAKKLGISRTSLYNKMKLASAHSKVLEVCRDGKLGGEIATKLARLPMSVQPIALKKIQRQEPDPEKGPQGTKMVFMAVREADQVLKGNFTAKLESAPFDTALTGLAGRGSCDDCSKCSTNEEALLADLGAGVCTDLDCFGEKKTAYVQWRIDDAKARGVRVYEGDEALAICPRRYGGLEGFTQTRFISEFSVYPGEDAARWIGYEDLVKLAGVNVPVPALLVSPHADAHGDRLIEIVTDDEASFLLALLDDEDDDGEGEDGDEAPRQNARPAPVLVSPEVLAVRNSWHRILVAIANSIRTQKRTVAELRYMILAHVEASDEIAEFIAEAWGWVQELSEADDNHSAFMAGKLATMSPDEMGQLLVALHVDRACPYDAEGRLELAATYGVNVVEVAGQAKPDDEDDRVPDLVVKAEALDTLDNLELQLEPAGEEA